MLRILCEVNFIRVLDSFLEFLFARAKDYKFQADSSMILSFGVEVIAVSFILYLGCTKLTRF